MNSSCSACATRQATHTAHGAVSLLLFLSDRQLRAGEVRVWRTVACAINLAASADTCFTSPSRRMTFLTRASGSARPPASFPLGRGSTRVRDGGQGVASWQAAGRQERTCPQLLPRLWRPRPRQGARLLQPRQPKERGGRGPRETRVSGVCVETSTACTHRCAGLVQVHLRRGGARGVSREVELGGRGMGQPSTHGHAPSCSL